MFFHKNLCEIVINNHVEKMVLISTDKAVRPTSLMGATKRLAEMILQASLLNMELKSLLSLIKKLDFKAYG